MASAARLNNKYGISTPSNAVSPVEGGNDFTRRQVGRTQMSLNIAQLQLIKNAAERYSDAKTSVFVDLELFQKISRTPFHPFTSLRSDLLSRAWVPWCSLSPVFYTLGDRLRNYSEEHYEVSIRRDDERRRHTSPRFMPLCLRDVGWRLLLSDISGILSGDSSNIRRESRWSLREAQEIANVQTRTRVEILWSHLRPRYFIQGIFIHRVYIYIINGRIFRWRTSRATHKFIQRINHYSKN